MSRDERRRPAPGAHRGQRDADDDSDDLRYEGPISFNDLDDDEEEYAGAPGGGRVFFTATIIGAVVILLVAAALWLRRDRPVGQPLSDTSAYSRATLPATPPAESPLADETGAAEQPPAPVDDAPVADETQTARAPLPVRPAPQTAHETFAPGESSPAPAPAREIVHGAPDGPEIAPGEDNSPSPAASAAPAETGSSGDIDAAAQRGLALARSAGAGAYSLQLLYACREATVRRALSEVHSPELFVVPAGDDNGRTCYRVLWGRFANRGAAVAAASTVPQHFRDGGAPMPFALDKIATP